MRKSEDAKLSKYAIFVKVSPLYLLKKRIGCLNTSNYRNLLKMVSIKVENFDNSFIKSQKNIYERIILIYHHQNNRKKQKHYKNSYTLGLISKESQYISSQN